MCFDLSIWPNVTYEFYNHFRAQIYQRFCDKFSKLIFAKIIASWKIFNFPTLLQQNFPIVTF